MRLEHYQTSFAPLLVGVAIAVVLTLFLKETGPAIRAADPALARGTDGSNLWNREVRTTARKVSQP
jgi:glycerol uptake facilitator-like aquaporin